MGNDPLNCIDEFGLSWYKPWTWNWGLIGSAFEGKFGGELGLEAKVKISKLEGEIGGEYGVGYVGNLGGCNDGKDGVYVEGKIGAVVKLGVIDVGLSKEAETQVWGDRNPDNDHDHIEETSETVLGIHKENASIDSKDGWATVKVGATVLLIHGEIAVNFGTIWKGITQ